MIALIAQRSLGEEGIMLADNIQARQGLSVAMSQAERRLYSYIRQNGDGNVTVDFAYGGGAAITDQGITSTDPENPGAGETVDTGVDISAWVSGRRGYWYKITAVAKIDQVELTSHKWVRVNPCNTMGGLVTIATGLIEPGQNAIGYSENTGQVFFTGEVAGPSVNFYAWSETDGLSTLVDGQDDAGFTVEATRNGRVFFGEAENNQDNHIWTWHRDTGLTTILSPNIMRPRIALSPDEQVLFIVENWDGAGDSLWQWSESGGLSTIIEDYFDTPAWESIIHIAEDNRIYLPEFGSSANVYTWHQSTGISTIVSGVRYPGRFSMVLGPATDRLYFGQDNNGEGGPNSHVWTYHPSTGLSTVIDTLSTGAGGSLVVGPDDRVHFNAFDQSTLYTWHPATGLSTISGMGGTRRMAVSHSGYVSASKNGNAEFWQEDAGPISESAPGGWNVGYLSINAQGSGIPYGFEQSALPTPPTDASGDRFVFNYGQSGGSPYPVYTWAPDTGLSVIIADADKAGIKSIASTAGGWFMVGQDSDPGNVWIWHKDSGLSTILTSADTPGVRAMIATSDGRFFFGAGSSTPENFYMWEPPASCDDLGY